MQRVSGLISSPMVLSKLHQPLLAYVRSRVTPSGSLVDMSVAMLLYQTANYVWATEAIVLLVAARMALGLEVGLLLCS